MADFSEISLNAPSLGANIIGQIDKENNVALFRGIPFATVEKRWTHSVLRNSLDQDFDARSLGYRCSQLEGMVLVAGGTDDPIPGDDEFKCLNLNIAVPEAATGSEVSKPLPVMVWIHGGAFAFGANSVARYRPQAFVAHSRKHGTPVILVQINYRLGPFGFSASNDLAEEANGGSRTHPVGNYGLIDQRNALEWVNKHIQDFGGDPWNITVFGVSAGSVSTHLHILAEHSLFDRAIMMSGAAPVISPLRMECFETEWKSLCRKTSINGSTYQARLRQLRSLSVKDILENSTSAAMGPVADGKLLREDWKYDDGMSDSRCKEIILGDTDIEGIIFDGLLKRLSQMQFFDLADKHFSPQLANEFFTNFGFKRDNQSEEDFRKAFRTLVGNTLFNYSNVGIAKASCNSDAWRDNVYLYHMAEPSPFSGPTNGLSYHGLCAMFLYLNELANLPPDTQKVSREMARIWTAFAHGKQPWEPYSKTGRFMRFGPRGDWEMHNFESDDTRDYKFQAWLGEHIEEVGRFIRDITSFF